MNSYGQYLRSIMPFISSAPAVSPRPTADNPDVDPAEAEAVFRSYHHRLGRPPTLEELRGALGLETDEPVTVVQARPDDAGTGLGLIGEAKAKGFGRTAPKVSIVPIPTPSGDWPSLSSQDHPYLNAQLQSSRALWQLPGLVMSMAGDIGRAEPQTSPPVMATFLERADEALRADARAYDLARTDPNKSYQTYSKERRDLGNCRYSEKLDPSSPCYYAGYTGNEYTPQQNVDLRGRALYPSDSYYHPKLDCTTRSLMAARGREQEMIDYYRAHNVSDNMINSIRNGLLRPYFMEMARRECGHIPLPPIVRR